MNKIYTSVNHDRLEPYLNLVGYNYRKAVFLEEIVFSTSYTTYNLPNSSCTKKWATRTYLQLSEKLNIPISTLKNYMKSFCDEGWVVKVQKKSCNQVKMYFRATDKIFKLLGNSTTAKPANDNKSSDSSERKNFGQSCTINNSSSELPYINRYKEQNSNIITPLKREKNCGKHHFNKPNHDTEALYNLTPSVEKVFNDVGERLSVFEKRSIWGMLCKLHKQHRKDYAKRADFVAWVCFALINSDYQLKGCETLKHKLNRISSLARSEKGFRIPIGFNAQWDVGIEMKKEKEMRAQKERALKQSRVAVCLDEPHSFESILIKKSDDIHSDKIALKDLQSDLGDVNKALRVLYSEIQSLPKLYPKPNQQEMRDKCFEVAQTDIEKFEIEKKVLEQKINKLKDTIDISKTLEWQGHYENEKLWA